MTIGNYFDFVRRPPHLGTYLGEHTLCLYPVSHERAEHATAHQDPPSDPLLITTIKQKQTYQARPAELPFATKDLSKESRTPTYYTGRQWGIAESLGHQHIPPPSQFAATTQFLPLQLAIW
ncbi:hypothetical protein BJX99DRAFT_216995 [Aspergillus californicus]